MTSSVLDLERKYHLELTFVLKCVCTLMDDNQAFQSQHGKFKASLPMCQHETETVGNLMIVAEMLDYFCVMCVFCLSSVENYSTKNCMSITCE